MRTKLGVCAALALAAVAMQAAELPTQKQVFLSQVYTIDKIYRSMEGPGSIDQVYIGDPLRPELVWVTAIKTEMVGADGTTPQLPEFMCHVNVDLDSLRHSALFGLKRATATRLITLSQGMIDARFPAGYGYPLASNEPLSVYTQVLNLNIQNPRNMQVRHRITFEYVRDRDLKTPLKPLFNVGASGTVLMTDPGALQGMATAAAIANTALGTGAPAGHAGMDMHAASDAHSGSDHGPSCLIAARAPNATGGASSDYTDSQGRRVTGHWVVPPGRQVNTSDITWFMQLPFDAKLHWAAAHLHPYAKSLAIRDTTTGKTVFEVKATGPEHGIGLTHVDTFESPAGVMLYRDHKYELTSVYENPTQQNSDSMASAFLALEDPEFVRPDAETLHARGARFLDDNKNALTVVRTSLGDFTVELLRDTAPNTVKAFLRMARSGVYTDVPLQRSADALSAKPRKLNPTQEELRLPYMSEHALKQRAGVLSMCEDSTAGFTIAIATSDELDARCSAFANVTLGAAVVRALATGSEPLRILRVDVYEEPDAQQITLAPLSNKVPQS